jgi:HEAT repeat protein
LTARPSIPASSADVRAVEELLRVLAKGQRALQMYLPNNPMYQRAMVQITDAFAPVWSVTGRLVLDIHEDRMTWDDAIVHQGTRGEGLAWQLHNDGLRRLTLLPGVETDEIVRFLQVVNRARMLPADASDDLLTLLWEQEFVLISYLFVEALGDGLEFLQESPVREPPPTAGDARAELAEAGAAVDPAAAGLVDLSDFDATPYFLDDSEVRLIRSELDEEYRRDIRQVAIDSLLDVLESQREPVVRHEVIALLEDILPAQLAVGGFKAVARILRELRVISARAHGLDQELHRAVLSFEERLSTPEILEQLFRVLADNATRLNDEDVGEVLRELKPSALPAVLSQLGRLADPMIRRTLESSVESIARSEPQALGALVQSGPLDARGAAISLAARLGLSQLVPAIIEQLSVGDEAIRLAAVRALGEFGTPTAIPAIESALADTERSVRQMALSLLRERGGSGGLLPRLEAMLFTGPEHEWERSERRSMFEAYGQLAGEAAMPRLKQLLERRGMFRRKEAPEVKACALFALGKVGSFEARLLVDRFTNDKEPVVRSAANTVLRDWMP